MWRIAPAPSVKAGCLAILALVACACNRSPVSETSEYEAAAARGKAGRVGTKDSHYCNPGSETACVNEKYLFCTNKVCVEDVTLGPGAVTIKHGHTTDHMLIAVSDYELTDDTEGKAPTIRTKKSGEVEYIPAGIRHQLTNTGKDTARFIVVVFR